MSKIEQSWYQAPGLITLLLLPCSGLFWLLSTARKWLYKRHILTVCSSKTPIIVVGNISVGGNGKTPFVIWLAQYLQDKNLKVAVISRGYGGHSNQYPILVTETTPSSVAGDEPVLIYRRLRCLVMVGPDRQASIEKLNREHQPDIIISDDGMQHYKMARTLECCIVDSERQFGNNLLLPAGPLRETRARLKSVDLVIENGGEATYRYDLQTAALRYVVDDKIVTQSVRSGHATSAIGNPKRFEASLNALGYTLKSTLHFRDHFAYDEHDFAKFNDDIVFMTEKDAVKCRRFAKPTWYYLPVDAKPTQPVIDTLNSLLKEKGILNGL
ncbi:tetraacyldisaccharide 4'-kinase [Pseudoalteromonas mariniglutinosa]|uniref:tetraacyldisaccharide 4'-kinase n=1 Tax=Pseudoalteromonas mariniglutinosa TaxID=206042 RepID=UPI00384E5D39